MSEKNPQSIILIAVSDDIAAFKAAWLLYNFADGIFQIDTKIDTMIQMITFVENQVTV
jgi:hypothetical protein